MGLDDYIRKRNFEDTPEPEARYSKSKGQRFVIQRHQASRLHYDLRLELEGVLKSWAIPKGPSMNPNDKRLAIQTEDHPVRYLDFQGIIPRGNYGAGQMDIWDSGTFSVPGAVSEAEALEQLNKGDLKLEFFGKQLKGTFALVQIQNSEKNVQWLLIKKKDEFATQLSYDAEVFASNSSKSTKAGNVKKLKPQQLIQPMLATPGKKIFDDPDWLYEIKWDGYRMIAHCNEGKVSLYSRNGISYDQKFASLHTRLSTLDQDVILDGEVVLVDSNGLPLFQELQNYTPATKGALQYYVFDLLYLNGYDMRDLPLVDRKSLLKDVLEDVEGILYCDHIDETGTSFYAEVLQMSLEGVIAKKKDSVYTTNYRTEDWLKFKASTTEDVRVCGYTESKAGGKLFGSLILGMYEEGHLRYVGNCGTGFSRAEQKRLLKLFEEYELEVSPFTSPIDLKGRTPHWLQPKLVCEVAFAEWTKKGRMRHPVYRGLRDDKITSTKSTAPIVSEAKKVENIDSSSVLVVEGLPVRLSNLEKIFWPGQGYRKYDLIDHYLKIAPTILPHLQGRPQNLHRHPNGIDELGFYQKDLDQVPEWVHTEVLVSKSAQKKINYLLCQNEATLLYMANLGCIELNPWNSKIGQLKHPDYAIIDLDPSPENSFDEVIEVAQAIHHLATAIALPCYCKTSGSKGLHIYIPLAAQYTYEEARHFTKLLCYIIQEKLSTLTTMERTVKRRNGKIYLDYLQNRKGQSVASVYCVRPKPEAPVSTPLHWKEVKEGLKTTDFTIANVASRIDEVGDLFRPVIEQGIDMEEILMNLETKDLSL